jgi:hypothetical protein
MRLRHRISASASILTFAGVLATAQTGAPPAALPSPVTGAVRPIDSPAPDGSAQPNLVSDRRGRVWMTWLEPRQTGGGHRFRAAQLTGNRWTEPVTIAEDTNFLANWADFPSLFVASDGTLAAHWLERTTGREAYFVRIRTSNDTGRTWSPTITPHKDTSATEHGFVSFFDAPGGGVGLVWLDGRDMSAGPAAAGHTAGMTLRSTVIRKGVPGDETTIDARVCECCQTSATRAAGGVLVAYRDRSDKEIRDTSVVRFADGKWSAPITVGTDNWEINGCPVNGPVITATGNAAAVAWFTGAGNTPKTQVAFSQDAGRTFDPPIRIDSATTLGRLGMFMPSTDRVLVTSLERTPTGARVVLRDVRRDGRMSEPVEITTATPDRTGGFLRLASAGSRLVAAWTDVRPNQPPRVKVATLEVR